MPKAKEAIPQATLEHSDLRKTDFEYFIKPAKGLGYDPAQVRVWAKYIDNHYVLFGRDTYASIFGVVEGDKKDEAIRRVRERAESKLKEYLDYLENVRLGKGPLLPFF